MSSVTFEMKREFSANQDLLSTRSRFLKQPETGSQREIFSLKLPDFSVKLYRHRTVSRKKEKWTFSDAGISQPHEAKRRSEIFSPNIIIPTPNKDSPKFITSHKLPDGLQSQLTFTKKGKFPSDPYRNPKPHNFRLVSLKKFKICLKHFSLVVLTFQHKMVIY